MSEQPKCNYPFSVCSCRSPSQCPHQDTPAQAELLDGLTPGECECGGEAGDHAPNCETTKRGCFAEPSPSPEAMQAANELARLLQMELEDEAAQRDRDDIARALDAFAKQAVDAERERCALACETVCHKHKSHQQYKGKRGYTSGSIALRCAEAIRARGTTGGGK